MEQLFILDFISHFMPFDTVQWHQSQQSTSGRQLTEAGAPSRAGEWRGLVQSQDMEGETLSTNGGSQSKQCKTSHRWNTRLTFVILPTINLDGNLRAQ